LMEDTGRLKNGEDALDTFDKSVREQLPKAMKASSLGYKHCVMVSLSCTAHALDSLASDVLAGEHLRVIVSRCWYWVALGLVGFPMLCMIISSMAKRCLHLTGWVEVLYTGAVWGFINASLAALAVSSWWFFGVHVAVSCLEFTVIQCTFFRRDRTDYVRHSLDSADSVQESRRMRLTVRLGTSIQHCHSGLSDGSGKNPSLGSAGYLQGTSSSQDSVSEMELWGDPQATCSTLMSVANSSSCPPFESVGSSEEPAMATQFGDVRGPGFPPLGAQNSP